MRRIAVNRLLWAVVLTLLFTAAFVQAAPKVENFTFIQVSDIHTPQKESADTIAQIATLGEVELTPYKVKALPPSFAIATGDLTEFGGGDGAWETFLSYWKDVKIPTYFVAGNHDNTWDCIRYRLRKLPQSTPYFSFDRFGCHFVGLESPTIQEPLPNFSEEQMDWLKKDLARVDPETPLFVFFHHPLSSSEFTSDYDKIRLLDVLRGHNVAVILGGHSHGATYYTYGGFDCVLGGSPFGKIPGMAVISVTDGTLRITYKKASEATATLGLLEKPLFPAKPYPRITFASPKARRPYTGSVPVAAWIKLPKDAVKEAKWKLDGDKEGVLALKSGGSFAGTVDTTGLVPGAHYLTAVFTTPEGSTYESSVQFYCEPASSPVVWRAFLPASIKGQVTASGNTVYAGGEDGVLYALDVKNGKIRWTFKTGGEILSQPLVTSDSIYVTSGDGKLYCLDLKGKPKWDFAASGQIYASPVISDGLVMFGSNDTDFYAVDAVKGTQAWKYVEPAYTIEAGAAVSDGTVYFGAWDGYVYGVNVKDGSQKLKCQAQGSLTQKAFKYFSAADCPLVLVGGKIYAADRNYDFSILDAATGALVSTLDTTSAVGLSQDGKSVYLRRTKGDLTKIDLNGTQLWSVPAGLNRVPAAPVESDGIVYTVSANGLLSAFSASDGSKILDYRVTPYLFVLSSVEARNGLACIGGMDGSVTALKVKR